MPSLDLPIGLNKPLKIQISHIHYDRMGQGAGPLVRVVVSVGYYETDADGNPVLNAIGFPKFVPVNVLTEFDVLLSDPTAQAIIAAREPEYRIKLAEHIASGSMVPIMAVWDDYQTQLCLDLYSARYLAPPPVVIPDEPAPPVE